MTINIDHIIFDQSEITGFKGANSKLLGLIFLDITLGGKAVSLNFFYDKL